MCEHVLTCDIGRLHDGHNHLRIQRHAASIKSDNELSVIPAGAGCRAQVQISGRVWSLMTR